MLTRRIVARSPRDRIRPKVATVSAEVAVLCEPVSAIISLISGKNTGKLQIPERTERYQRKMSRKLSGLRGKFPARVNREFGAFNRESLDQYQGKGFPR